MAALRLVFILLVFSVGDFAAPLLLEAMEGAEESETALHRARGRRSLRLIRAVSPPPPMRQVQAASVPSPARVSGAPARRAAIGGQVRKTPAPVPDPASVSEDH
jgi:hypothetical protein